MDTNMETRTIKVFLNIHFVTGGGCRAQWISRRVGQEMYTSKKCATEEEATALARKWIARNTHIIDTTRGGA